MCDPRCISQLGVITDGALPTVLLFLVYHEPHKVIAIKDTAHPPTGAYREKTP